MRYTRIRHASWALALLLAAVALATAMVRSRPPEPPTAHPAAAAIESWRPVGYQVFQAHCASCHPRGEAAGHAIPPLRVRFVERFGAPGGRPATIDLLLLGESLDGEAGAHPDYPELSDLELAAVVNHMLVAWGNHDLLPAATSWVTPQEVARRRP
jgi:mono/diheme cytochrome c family protein